MNVGKNYRWGRFFIVGATPDVNNRLKVRVFLLYTRAAIVWSSLFAFQTSECIPYTNPWRHSIHWENSTSSWFFFSRTIADCAYKSHFLDQPHVNFLLFFAPFITIHCYQITHLLSKYHTQLLFNAFNTFSTGNSRWIKVCFVNACSRLHSEKRTDSRIARENEKYFFFKRSWIFFSLCLSRSIRNVKLI